VFEVFLRRIPCIIARACWAIGDGINSLGGPAKLAQAVGSTPGAVAKWRVQGVPYRYHAPLRAMMRRRRWSVEQVNAILEWRPGK
jgi:hypothetical protein